MAEIVKVEHLQKKFGKFQALSDVSFTVNPGEVLGFIGPNGAGKSTTIRTLLGIIHRDGGRAEIFEKDVWKDSLEIHKRISYVPGDVALWGSLTGGEIIDLFMKLHGNGDKAKLDLSQYLGHILVETVTSFVFLPALQTPVGLDSVSSYGFDFDYKILQCN